MRHEKATLLIDLARALASSAEGLTLDEMARSVGTGRRTAERLRDALEALFPQMEALQEGSSKRFKIPGGLDGFLQAPTTEELLELAKSAAALRTGGYGSQAEVLERLDRKVRSAMKAPSLRRLAPDVEALARAEATSARAGPRPFEDPDLLASIRHAIMSMSAIRFRYTGGSQPGKERLVCPYGVLFERMNYLIGADLGGETVRTWRLDRILDLEVTGAPAWPPESFDLNAYASQSFGIYQDAIETVVLKVLAHGAEDALIWRFHPTQSIEEQNDGALLVTFKSSGMLELAWHLFTWGDKIQILQPQRLKTVMTEQLELAARRHSDVTTVPVVDIA